MKNKRKISRENPPAAATSSTPFNWDLTLKILAAVISVATLGFGVYQFAVKPRFEAEAERRRSKERLYNEAMKYAAAFANASTQDEADAARKEFWNLYIGQLSAVESPEVKEAMQTFGGGIKAWEGFNDPSDFTKPADYEYLPPGQKETISFAQMSYRLSQVCRADLEDR
jgi:hypothetical protein